MKPVTNTSSGNDAPQGAGPVLLVSADAGLHGLLDQVLVGIGDTMPRGLAVRPTRDAVRTRDLRRAAAVIVDCRLDGDEPAWRDLARSGRALPFILVVPDGGRSAGLRAIMDGAQDFIEAGELDEHRLRRSIECAVERLRVEQAMSRARDLGKVLGLGSAVTAGLYGLGALEKTLPGDHRFLVAEYRGVLRRVLENYGVDDMPADTKNRLVELVERIGALRGTPRDLVDIHSQALRKLLDGLGEQRRNAVAAEARFVLLEALGYLAYYFRRYSVQLPL